MCYITSMIDRAHTPDHPGPLDLAALDNDGLRARVSSMPLDRQTDLVLGLDWAERVRVIRNCPAPRQLVSGMPDEEVLLTIKGLGEEDTLDLIGLTSPGQLRFILDVELWTRDSPDTGKILRWLDYIIGCGERKIVESLDTLDRELLVIMLARLIHLIPNEPEAPHAMGVSGIVPDEFFTILPRRSKETEKIKLLLRVMRQWDRGKFYDLLFAVHDSSHTDMEEEAYRWRNSRLEEKGLLEFEEAVGIYAYIGEEEARSIAREAEPPPPVSDIRGIPAYPLRLAGKRTFFARVLSTIEDGNTRNRIRAEMAFAGNRLLVADAGSIGEIESMKKALDRLFSFANVGILFLSGGVAERAREILERVPVRDIFQTGFSRAVDLKSTAGRLARRWWPVWRTQGFRLLGFPEEGVMAGLMNRVPQYYGPGSGEGAEFRDFETMDDVRRTATVLNEIAAAADTCFGVLGVPAPPEARVESSQVLAGDIEQIDLRNLLATCFVNLSRWGEPTIKPVDMESIKSILEIKPGGGAYTLREEAVNRFLTELKSRTGREGADWTVLERFARKALAALEEEVQNIHLLEDADARYLRSVILRKPSGGGKRRG